MATVGSVELKIVEPASGTGPLRAGLYLHGDGAGAHKSGSVLKAMLPWADAKHGLGVSALAPNGCAWWQTPTHDCNATTNDPDTGAESSKALAAALTALFAAYDVRTDALDYYGSSGGSIFLTDQWLPLHAGEYPGVFALMCGGSTPGHAYAWDTNDAALRGKSPLFFTYGDQDFLVDDILDAMTSFKAKSFSVTEKVIPGATHCAFDAHAEAIGLWQ